MEQRLEEKPVVAAFDFDGTITYRDSLTGFLIYSSGWCQTGWKLLLALPKLAAWIMGMSTRQHTKESVLTRFFKGKSLSEIGLLGAGYAKEKLPAQVRPEALERICWHKEQGHRLVLISASLGEYLEPWGRFVGFNDFITSSLETTQEGVVTGKLKGENCWGKEKPQRLLELLGPKEEFTLYAYGNSKGDLDLLQIADYRYYKKLS